MAKLREIMVNTNVRNPDKFKALLEKVHSSYKTFNVAMSVAMSELKKFKLEVELERHKKELTVSPNKKDI